MITQLSPLFARVATSVKPEDTLLQKGAWIKFSSAWAVNDQAVAGRSFVVTNEPVLVKYPISRIIPGNDFIDIDLSNQTMPTPGIPGTQQLYPMQKNVLYQMFVGLKKGHYFIPTYIAGVPTYSLSSSYLTGPIYTDTRRYLGAKTYEDSPEEAPLWSFYSIMNMPSIVLRLYADVGIDFEKVVLVWNINKCRIQEKTLTPDQLEKALELPFYTEFKDF